MWARQRLFSLLYISLTLKDPGISSGDLVAEMRFGRLTVYWCISVLLLRYTEVWKVIIQPRGGSGKKKSDVVTQKSLVVLDCQLLHAIVDDQNGNAIFLKTTATCLPCPVACLLHEHMDSWVGWRAF